MGFVRLTNKTDLAATLFLLEKDRCERSLSYFIKKAWPIVEPGNPYVGNWHIDLICAHLEAISNEEVVDGELYNRLLINVPPGMMKEVSVDTLVLTRRGRIRLGDVVVGDQILTHRGRYRSVTAVHERGIQNTLKITTENGRVVIPELRHPFLTPNGWIEAKDLRVGDTLGAVHPIEEGMSSDISPEEARFLGYLIGDGGVTHSPIFSNAEKCIRDDFIRCCESLGLSAVERAQSPSALARNAISINVGIRGAGALLRKYDLVGKDSYTKRIPPQILAAPKEIIANFLGAYWSCDGQTYVRHTGKRGAIYASTCTTVSEGLAYDIQHALLRVGIDARVRCRSRNTDSQKQPGGLYKFYMVMTTSAEEVIKFRYLPGLCDKKKEPLWQLGHQRFVQGPLFEDRILSIEPADPVECRCLTVEEDHSFTANDIAVHNSLLVGVFWPAFEWGPKNKAHLRYLCVSHTVDVSQTSLKMRMLIESEWYQERWKHVRLTNEQNAKLRYINTATGFRAAVSMSTITGQRGDRIILDDMMSWDDANSEQVRASTTEWFLGALPSRLIHQGNSAIVCIEQRLHEQYISGTILEHQGKGLGWDHLCLPMKFDASFVRPPNKLGYQDPRTQEGELLFPERFSEAALEKLYRNLTPYEVAGQMQQTPIPKGGGIIKDDWWTLWKDNNWPELDYILGVVDTAYGEKQENDFSAMIVFGVFTVQSKATISNTLNRYGTKQQIDRVYAEGAPNVLLMEAWRGRLAFPDLVKKTLKTAKDYKLDRLIVEDKAAGISVVQELRRIISIEDFGISLVTPKGDKWQRLHSVSHLWSEGMVWAPDKEWAEMVIREVASFPKGKHDDLVDCCSHGMKYLRDNGMLTRAPERLYDIEESKRYLGKAPSPLYPG